MRFFKKSSYLTDEELMQRVHEGNERALEEIYYRYSPLLLKYFHRMLWREEQKAQDFLHDLFLKIIEHPHRFNPESKFSTWIYSVANNMCKNEYRKIEFRKSVNGLHSKDLVHFDSIAQQMDHSAFQFDLNKSIERLDHDEKSLFVLRYELEKDLDEIARILDCPEGTVKSKLFYLRKKLSKQLQQHKTIFD